MRTHGARNTAVAFLMAWGLGVTPAAFAAVCTSGTWNIVDGPVTLESMTFDAVALDEGIPTVHEDCDLLRWSVQRYFRGTKIRALFSCDAIPQLRLRALVGPGCVRMRGALSTPRPGSAVRFFAVQANDDVCGGIAGVPCPTGLACELPRGQCEVQDLQGTCVPLPDACPEFAAPVCGCDGVTYANPCFALQAGAQIDHDGRCGCRSNDDCDEDAFCSRPAGDCDARGQCEPRPLGCPDNVDPVCGCDGRTYSNRCDAAAAGTSIAHAGTCDVVCGGIAGVPCPKGQFCELPAGECSSADLQGTCVETGGFCPLFYDPVCGCDGVTYGNDCERQRAGAQKDHDGACRKPRCETACDCYRVPGLVFEDSCPLMCPNCGSYWSCRDGACVEQCGQIPPDVGTCGIDVRP